MQAVCVEDPHRAICAATENKFFTDTNAVGKRHLREEIREKRGQITNSPVAAIPETK